MKFKYIIIFITLASFGSIFHGFSIQGNAPDLGHKFIGFGTAGLFFLAMPLFLIKESKGKKMKDYMLNKENIIKMQKQNLDKTENQ